ncbi:unnamed protein product, partial [Ascophyllum nodosum]
NKSKPKDCRTTTGASPFTTFFGPGVQMIVGDGTNSGTELSVFEISLGRGGNATAPPPTIVSIQPDQISSEGGEIVKLFGFSFDALRELYVQFGSDEPVVAT